MLLGTPQHTAPQVALKQQEQLGISQVRVTTEEAHRESILRNRSKERASDAATDPSEMPTMDAISR